MAIGGERLPNRVWLLGWISLFADVASEMVYPLIPIFVTTVIGAPVAVLGAVEGFANAIVSFMRGWSGWHSDRTGRRVPYIRWGYGLSALGKPLLALAQAGMWPIVLLARGGDRFGKGLRTTARDALLADSVPKTMYGRAFGLHRGLDTAGAFLGGVLAIVLLELLPGQLRTIFVIAVIPGLASVLLTFFIKEPDRPPASEPRAPISMATLRELPRPYWRALGLMLMFGLADTSDTFLLLRANELFTEHLKVSPGAFGGFLGAFTQSAGALGPPLILTTMAYLLYNLTYVGVSYPAGALSDRIGRWRLIAMGWALYAGVYLAFAFAKVSSVWLLLALYGVYSGLTQGVGKALVADHAPAHARGTALGLFYMSAGFATLAGNIIAGFLWDARGPHAAFLFSAALAAAALLLIPATRPFARGNITQRLTTGRHLE